MTIAGGQQEGTLTLSGLYGGEAWALPWWESPSPQQGGRIRPQGQTLKGTLGKQSSFPSLGLEKKSLAGWK